MYKLTLIFLFVIPIISPIISQNNSQPINIGVIEFFHPSRAEVARKAAQMSTLITLLGGSVDYEGFMGEVRQFKNYAIEVLLNDNRFRVVERDKLNFIQDERELQKAEEFIDGFTVEQGKALGAEYLLLGDFTLKGYVLSLSIYSVADERVIEKEAFPLVKSQLGDLLSSSEKMVQKITRRLIHKAFPPNIKLLRILKGDSKAKEVLVAGGKKIGLTKKDRLVIREIVMEKVDSIELPRLVTVAELNIIEVEGDHFSRCRVVKGGNYLSKELAAKKDIYCSLRED